MRIFELDEFIAHVAQTLFLGPFIVELGQYIQEEIGVA